MSLQEKLDNDLKQALKDGNKKKASTIRMIKTDLSRKMSEGSRQESLEDGAVLDVISKLVKQRRESIEEFEKADREDLAKEEQEELEILKTYLPDLPDAEEIEATIEEVIDDVGATDMRHMGDVMKNVMNRFEGIPVDGSEINEIVREKLS